MKSAEDCKLLRSGIDSVQKWCIENYIKINMFKINTVYFIRKTNSIHFELLCVWYELIVWKILEYVR
jgi:hypothetical protein